MFLNKISASLIKLSNRTINIRSITIIERIFHWNLNNLIFKFSKAFSIKNSYFSSIIINAFINPIVSKPNTIFAIISILIWVNIRNVFIINSYNTTILNGSSCNSNTVYISRIILIRNSNIFKLTIKFWLNKIFISYFSMNLTVTNKNLTNFITASSNHNLPPPYH